MSKIASVLLLLILAVPVFAQESEDLDSLFEGELLEEEGDAAAGEGSDQESSQTELFEEEIFEESAEQEEIAPEEAFLVSEQLEWGGSFDLTFDAQVSWDGYPAPWDTEFWQASSTLTPRLAADLFFDARPERDFRVFGKVKAAYQYPEDWNIGIFELFSDFQFKDLLFFRVGKQTVQWGVGYFFSPADVLNLVSIDLEDPEAEREGPIAVKAHLPFSAHNLYLYLITNNIIEPSQIAVAPKLELLLGNYELGIGGFYKIDETLSPKGMLTLTGPLWDLDLFAEALVQLSSDRTFARYTIPPDYETYSPEVEQPFSFTAGFSYLNSDWNLSLFAQYFYNGQAYDAKSLSPATLDALDAGDITAAVLLYPGLHYLATSISWFEIGDSSFSVSLLYLANFSDGSGLLTPTVSWEPIDHVSLSTGFRISYSDDTIGDEYAPTGGSLAWTIGVSLGSGRF
jgi:hypothetical protein